MLTNEEAEFNNSAEPNNTEQQSEKVEEEGLVTNQEDELITIPKVDWEKQQTILESHKKRIRKQQAQLDQVRNTPSYSARKSEDNVVPKNNINPDDYPTHEAYIEALVDSRFSGEKISELVNRSIENREISNIRKQHITRLQDRIEKMMEKNPDCQDVIYSNAANALYEEAPDLAPLVESMPNNAEIAYYLGDNLDELRRLVKLPAVYRAAEIARLNQRVDGGASQRQSNAPSPIKPLKSGHIPQTKTPEEMSDEEFFKMKEKQLRRN